MRILIILSLLFFMSCGGDCIESTEYEIRSGEINHDGSYTYTFKDSSFFDAVDDITTKKIFKIGDKFTVTINKVEVE